MPRVTSLAICQIHTLHHSTSTQALFEPKSHHRMEAAERLLSIS